MFSTGHIIWIIISAVIITGGFVVCMKLRPHLKTLLKICLAIGVISEVIKVFYEAEIVPMVDPVIVSKGGELVTEYRANGYYTPYLGMEHLPLELCSLFIFFMLAALLLKSDVWKKRLYALMFTSGTLGGVIGIVMSAIAVEYNSTYEFLTSFRAWQFFIYHSMVVLVSLYIGFGGESGLVRSDWKKAIIALLILDVPTFYLNSVFSEPVYVHDRVAGVTHRINYFSSYLNPLGIAMTEKWQWILYIIIRDAAAVILVYLLFLLLRKDYKNGKEQNA